MNKRVQAGANDRLTSMRECCQPANMNCRERALILRAKAVFMHRRGGHDDRREQQPPDEDARRARTDAASDIRAAIDRAVTRYATATGHELQDRRAWPGALTTYQYADPATGIRAATDRPQQRRPGHATTTFARPGRTA